MFGSVRARAAVLLSSALLLGAASIAPAQAATRDVSGTVSIGTSAPGVSLGVVATSGNLEVDGTTDSQGAWRLTLPASGAWRICFNEQPNDYQAGSLFLDDPMYSCVDYAVDTSVSVPPITKSLPRASSLTGSVNAAASVVRLLSLQPDGTWGSPADPNTSVVNGSFEIDQVPDGDYKLCFDDADAQPLGCDGGTWPESATTRSLRGDHITLGSAVTLPARRTVSGTVRANDGTALTGASVDLLRSTTAGLRRVYSTVSGAGGGWTLSALPGPASYRLRVTPPSTDSVDATTTSTVAVSSGSGTLVTPPLVLDQGGSVSGHLTVPTGESGVLVQAFTTDTSPILVDQTMTNGSNNYALPHLKAGTYTLAFAGDDFDDLARQTRTCTVGTTTCDATMSTGARFTGAVVDADVPLAGATVTATSANGVLPTRSAVTSNDGTFSLVGLNLASYTVSIDPNDGRAPRYATDGATIDVALTANQGSAFSAGRDLGIVDVSGVQGHVAPAAVPSILGTPQVGSTLTATTGTYSPAPTQVLYTWYADATQVTAPSVSPSYVVTPADVNRQISVQVTAQATGYKSARLQPTSGVAFAPKPVTPASPTTLLLTRGPSITGKAKVGKRLAVDPGAATPAAAVAMQWLRNGTPIARATGSSYKLAKADKGKRISVRVTYSRGGYASVVRTSAPTGKVAR